MTIPSDNMIQTNSHVILHHLYVPHKKALLLIFIFNRGLLLSYDKKGETSAVFTAKSRHLLTLRVML